MIYQDWKVLGALNYGTRGSGVLPKFIVLHDTANVGTHNETRYLASANEAGVSVCFTVERDGTVWKLTPNVTKNYTFHAGRNTKFRSFINREVNRHSIGIEICQMEKIVSYPDVQVKAVARLCAKLCEEYGLTRADITTHKYVITDGSREDPRQFPWSAFWAEFDMLLSPTKSVSPKQEAKVVEASAQYVPPQPSLARLDRIADLVRVSPRVTLPLHGLEHMCLIPGAVYVESDLDLDTDGAREPGVQYESTHQDQISIGRGVNSNRTPFFVLPMRERKGVESFAERFGLRLGDVATFIYGDKIEHAVYADNGPPQKIGEGSIALHRSLGFERIKNGRIVNVGIPRDVIMLAYPKTGNGNVQTPDRIRAIGQERFKALGGAA